MRQAIWNISPCFYVGTCSTAAGLNTKDITVPSFVIKNGCVIAVKYSESNYGGNTNCHLRINGSSQPAQGYGQVWYNGQATGSGVAYGVANHYIFYMWDGTYWVFVGTDA